MADKAQKTPMEEFLEDASEIDFDDEELSSQTEDSQTAESSQTDPDEGSNLDITELETVTGQQGTPDVDEQTAPAPVETPSPAAEVQPSAEQQPAVVAPAAPTEPQPAPTQEVTQPPATPQAPAPAAPAENIEQVFTDWRAQTEDLLAQHHYALSAEDMARLDTEPQEIIPRLLSKVYLDAVSASISQVVQYLPRMVRQVQEQDAINSQSENAFFERWPDLKAHQQTVVSIGQVYRQRNPQATAEQFINEVGAAAMVSLRLDPTRGMQPAAPAPAPAAPFVPAAQSPQGGAPKPAPSTNIFTQLDQEFSFEEDM